MSSTSGSEYRCACAEYLEAALLRPRMYFATLKLLEATMGGHETAFSQLGLIDRDESFNGLFAAWLRRETGVSAAAGWAHAVAELADVGGLDAEALFADRVRAFLKEWIPATN